MAAMRAVVMVVALGLAALGACADPRPAPAATLQGALEQVAARTVLTYAPRGLTPVGLALVAVRLGADGTTEWAQVNGDLPF